MNRVHQDVEANFLLPRSMSQGPLASRRNFGGLGLRQTRRRQTQGLTPWEFSTRYNVTLLIVSLIKFTACAAILGLRACDVGVQTIWICCNGVFEFIRSVLFITRIMNIKRLNNVLVAISEYLNLANNPRGRGAAQRGAARNQGEQRRTSVMQRQNTVAVRVLKSFLLIRRALEILNALWAIILIWGLVTIGIGSVMVCGSDVLNTFMLVFVTIGIAGLSFPVLYNGCECLCRPLMMLIILCIFGRPPTIPAPEVDISNLKIINYSSDLPGENECIICRVEYEEGDNLVQLKCSPMHHMHEDCGKKWLRVNGQCPMCRADINSVLEDEQGAGQ